VILGSGWDFKDVAKVGLFPDPEDTFRCRVLIPPETPVVLSVPHAGIATTGFDGALASTLDVRGDADLLVDQLYGVSVDATTKAATKTATDGTTMTVPRPGAPAMPVTGPERLSRSRVYVAAQLSRFICDMNRDPDDVSPAAVPEHPAPRNTDGRGFVWAITTNGEPALARPLSLEEWRARQLAHAAYHAAISKAVARARDRFGFALLVDGHSMPSVGRPGHKDRGHPRAEIVPGNRDGTSCSDRLSRAVETHFRSAGYSVSFNDPYKGGFITTHHGRPTDGVHAIQIEVRRDLYMDETAFTPRSEGFARLQATLRTLLETLDGFRP
jgi:N-formylglutamate deformylase